MMKILRKISYVLPVYNQELYLAKTLDSLYKQKEQGQIIVINDGSTDFTANIIEQNREKIDVIITNKTRKGSAYSRNRGNDCANGDYIAVCDCDIYYPERSLSILKFFEENPEKSVYYSALELREYNRDYTTLMEAYEWDFKSKCPISHPTVAYKRKVAEKVRYQEKSKDTDLYEFFLLDCHKNKFLFGGDNVPRMLKLENDNTRNREDAKKLKKQMYKKYKINI